MSSSADRAKTQRVELPLVVTKEKCSGGTYIVTGASGGIGLEAVRNLVSVGASRVIMAVRNIESGEKAKSSIESSTGIKDVAAVWPLNLTSYESVKAFANRAASELERIDALVENAGVAMGDRTMAEGHLLNVTVNVLSTFLLAIMLMPKMRRDADKFGITPHITIVSSGTGLDMPEQWESIKEDPIVSMEAEEKMIFMTYPLTKLMEVLAVRHISRLAPSSRTGVVINAVCPGLCTTDLDRNAPQGFRDQLAKERTAHGRTSDAGSRAILFGAVAGPESHGGYSESCEIANHLIPGWINGKGGEEMEKLAWDVIAAELEKTDVGCVVKALA